MIYIVQSIIERKEAPRVKFCGPVENYQFTLPKPSGIDGLGTNPDPWDRLGGPRYPYQWPPIQTYSKPPVRGLLKSWN